jgi:acyl carrier protein
MTGAGTVGSELGEVVCDLIARQLGVSPEAVRSPSRLVDDLRADLMSLTQLALALEDELDIEIADEEWIDVATVADVLAYVSSLVDRKGAQAACGGAGR